MKIAILHDFFGSIGGGEKLVLALAKELNADIYTTYIDKKTVKKITNYKINLIKQATSLPLLKVIHSSIIFRYCYVGNYDLYILSGNWSVFAAKKHTPNMYYMHTPVRMFYDSKWDIYKQIPWYSRLIYLIWTFFHSKFVEKHMLNVQKILTNSKNVKKRIKKYHNKSSKVIYPPIKKYSFLKNEDYWLSVNRIYPHKRIELQLEVFKDIPDKKLIIIGGVMKGDHSNIYLKKMIKKAPDNVIFLGDVKEQELEKYYGSCKGFITTSMNEDFGMTPLEAMSAGKPVIAVNEGGYKETITSKTGILVKPNKKEIIKSIEKIEHNLKINSDFYRFECEKNASKYSKELFIKKIKNEIKDLTY